MPPVRPWAVPPPPTWTAIAGLVVAAVVMLQLVMVPVLVGRPADGGAALPAAASSDWRTDAVPPVWLGDVIGPREQVGGGWQRRYAHGMLYYSQATGVTALRNGPILDRVRATGGAAGSLGFPATNETPATSPTGATARVALFQKAMLVETSRVRAVSGPALRAYQTSGGPGGSLGLPTTAVRRAAGVAMTHFERGSVFVLRSGRPVVLEDPVRRAYLKEGGPTGDLGPPKSRERLSETRTQYEFARGALVHNARTGRVGPPPPKPTDPVTVASPSTGEPTMVLTAPRSTTRSYYLTPNGDAAADQSRAYALGCQDAREGVTGLRVLAFGGQEEPGLRRPGLSEDWAGPHLSYGAATALAQSWIGGFASCRASGVSATVALGTNNYQWAQPVTGEYGGVLWARFVDGVADWAEASYSGVVVVGANDLEPSWGPPDLARAWADAYARTTDRPMLAFASADGCPESVATTSGGGGCNNGWTVADVHHVSTGAGPHFYAVPQIYRTDGTMARQWAAASAWGAATGNGAIRFAGVMSQEAACGTHGCEGTDNTPAQAWRQTRRALDAYSATQGTRLPGPTDITWMR